MLAETEAIVLHSRKYSDSSKLITAYTKEFGRLTFLAKGCRSPKSKFAAMLEPLSYLSFTFYKKAHSDLHLLSKSEIIQPTRKLFDSYDHLTSGLMICESLIQSQHDSEKNDELFDLLKDSVMQLNTLSANPYSVLLFFLSILASIIGFDISLKGDFSNKTYVFELETGEYHNYIRTTEKNIFYIEGLLLGKLSVLFESTILNCSEISFDDNEFKIAARFFCAYFTFHLDKKFTFNTLNVIS